MLHLIWDALERMFALYFYKDQIINFGAMKCTGMGVSLECVNCILNHSETGCT